MNWQITATFGIPASYFYQPSQCKPEENGTRTERLNRFESRCICLFSRTFQIFLEHLALNQAHLAAPPSFVVHPVHLRSLVWWLAPCSNLISNHFADDSRQHVALPLPSLASCTFTLFLWKKCNVDWSTSSTAMSNRKTLGLKRGANLFGDVQFLWARLGAAFAISLPPPPSPAATAKRTTTNKEQQEQHEQKHTKHWDDDDNNYNSNSSNSNSSSSNSNSNSNKKKNHATNTATATTKVKPQEFIGRCLFASFARFVIGTGN